MDDELRFSVDMNEGGGDATRSQGRSEAATANELVRRLSIYQAATTRIAPALGSADPTRDFDDSRSGDPREDNDSPSPFAPHVTSPLLLAPRHLRKQSLFFVDHSDDENADETPAPGSTTRAGHQDEHAGQVSWLHTPLTTGRNSPTADAAGAVVDRFDDEALIEYGRAANEHVFDIWLDLGERTTLADRMDWESAARAAEQSRNSITGGAPSQLVSEFSARRVDRQVVGTGLGQAAIDSIVEGRYDPATVLSSLIGSFWNTLDDATYLDACIIEVDKNEESMPTLSEATLSSKSPFAASRFSPDASARHRIGDGLLGATMGSHDGGAEQSARRRSIRTRSVVALENFFEVYRRQDSVVQEGAEDQLVQGETQHVEAATIDDALSIISQQDGLVTVSPRPPPDLCPPPSITVDNEGGGADDTATATTDAVMPLAELTAYKFELSLQRPSLIGAQESMSLVGTASVTSPRIKLPRCAQDSHRVMRKTIVQHRPQIARSIADTILKLSDMMSPFSFFDFLMSCTEALNVLNDGDPDCVVALPIQPPGEPPLVGAEQVMMYVKTNMFERAQEIGSSVNAAEWVLRYTTAFVNAQVAVDEEDALAREDILAECVQLLSDFKTMTTTVLSLGSKSRHYEEFAQLREWTEAQADALITPLEDRFESILHRCPFPDQRSLLKRHYKQLEHMTVNAVRFLSGFDSQWSSTIPYHAAWKVDFLNRSFLRLHGSIATSWMTASLGFVDPILTMLVKSDHGQNPHEFRKRISMAAKVEYMIAVEGVSFYNVAIICKGVASTVVGIQLCMGSRYLLDEMTNEHDDKWGFSMCDGLKGSSTSKSPAVASAPYRAFDSPHQSPSRKDLPKVGFAE